MLCRKALLAALLVSCLSAVATAAPTIVAGDWIIGTNTTTVIQITTTGNPGDEFQGADLQFAIGGGVVGPVVTALDMVGPGTLFYGNNNGQQDYGNPPWQAPGREPQAFITTLSGTVGPNGVLAFVTIDTTGALPGVYSISLTHPDLGPSDLPPFYAPATNLIDGTIFIPGPEPSSIVLGTLAIAGFAAILIRRRRKRRS